MLITRPILNRIQKFFLLEVDVKVPHKSAKFQNFSFNINRVMDFFLFHLYSQTTTKINNPELTRILSENEMCKRFRADALLSMWRTSFQTISLEILTFWTSRDCNFCLPAVLVLIALNFLC